MRYFFGVSLGILILLSIFAWMIQPKPVNDGKLSLVWVSDDNPARHKQIDIFNQLYPRYKLHLDPTNADMQKVIVQSLGGVGPDLFCAYDGFQLATMVKAGIAWDVTDELKKRGIDMQQDLWQGARPTYEYENRIYGFPTNVAVDAVWINKDIFDRMQIPYPRGAMTWDEFIPIAKKLTVRDSNGRIKHFGFLFPWNSWNQFVLQWGGRLYNPDGTRCVADSPEAIAATQFMHDLVYKYKVSPNPVEEMAMATQGGWGSGIMTLFGGGKGAMALGGRWWLCSLRDYKDLRMGAFECPYGKYRIYRGYGKSVVINKYSPRRQDALNFLVYMHGKEYNELINHQADALGPVKQYSFTSTYLHDPEFPKEDYNAVWRDVLNYGEPEQISPFVNGNIAYRILLKQLDLVKANQKTPTEAMQTVTRNIHEEMRRTLRKDPALRARYFQLTGKLEP